MDDRGPGIPLLSPGAFTTVAATMLFCRRGARCISAGSQNGLIAVGQEYQQISDGRNPVPVCLQCFRYYENKPMTTIRDSSTMPRLGMAKSAVEHPAWDSRGPDTEALRRINLDMRDQKGGSYVQPIGRVNPLTVQPVPGLARWPASQAWEAPARGYTVNHLYYDQDAKKRSSQAYAAGQPQTLFLNFAVHYVEPGKGGTHLYQFKIEDFSFRGKDRTDYDRFPPSEPLFYKDCFFSPRGKPKGSTALEFRRNKCFDVRLVMSYELFIVVEEHREAMEQRMRLHEEILPLDEDTTADGNDDNTRRAHEERSTAGRNSTSTRKRSVPHDRRTVQGYHQRYHMKVDWLADGCMAELQVDERAQAQLGDAGSFKTAHSGGLVLYQKPSAGATEAFAVNVRTKVAAKRWVITDSKGKVRVAKGQEEIMLAKELTNLIWARALLAMVYSEEYSTTGSTVREDNDRQMKWPEVRFVDAGLFRVTQPSPSKEKKGASRLNQTYLVEELIATEGDEERFIKYIGNSSPTPLITIGPEGGIARFLSFTQHFQYDRTGGLMFISDYQGCAGLLTDPQIMTNP
ncbi:hypothetical protein CALCODRAFT_506214 [Calocera cornea HHB12733]|uniref:Alpha-type protein kinase domain-containing protein n=1 Tax=Calocera cornea HHB12733 TaxID=1353952 RepID=A0A165J640_9BASI|nr:hypothetical protein CALCODRAFT_506214 [Calocera cornea HHB12733]